MGHIEFPETMHGQVVDCPHCGLSVMLALPGYKKKNGPAPAPGFLGPMPDAPPEPAGLLPLLTDESLRSIQVLSSKGAQYYTVNLIDYTCTCPSFVKDHANVPPRQYGRMCKHICSSLNQEKIRPFLDPICAAMVASGYGVYPGRLWHDNNGKQIYITGVSPSGWLNVYALKRVNGKTYYQFGYNVGEQRWAFGQRPNVDERIFNSPFFPGSASFKLNHSLLTFLKEISLVFFAIIAFLVSMVFNVFFALLLAFFKPPKRGRKHRL